MTSPTESPTGISAHPRYIVILALAAAAILTIGSMFRPRAEDASGVPQMPEGEIARLQVAAQRRSLEDDTNYFRTVSAEVGQAVMFLPDRALSGVAWGGDRVVTIGPPPATGQAFDATPAQIQRPRSRPVMSTAAPTSGVIAPPRVQDALRAGDWVLAIWDTGSERAFVPGRYVSRPPATCGAAAIQEIQTTVPLSPAMAGAGLFDMYGYLLGVVAPCGSRLAALTASSVDAILAEAAAPRGRLLDVYGLEVATAGQQELEHFGVDAGVLVRAVWAGDVADSAGLIPGDFIVAVDDTPVAAVEDLSALASGAEAPTLTVRRAGETVALPLSAPEDADGTPPVEITPGFTIDSVPADSAAARAGLVAGDRLIRLNQQGIRTAAQVRRLLAGTPATTTFVEVERAGRRSGLFIP